ncbi:MAG: hypothetical protein UT21_C0006G0042 [Candidatus Woesebacteria bacterium GW2011_GWA1_39_11b]|nr:MAG: hypothetical protein UT21_C0006G0042 [Candidatus Woesebacteria bacterium GW2011_GWA1_39_11b]KKS77120.1 MAG: hypothetical protein UV51_C0010G0025 [Candidatus Woesebacteria bacterium GW2011_GWC1_42_9]
MNNPNKYEEYRKAAQDGDIVLCRNTSWIGRQISKIDNAYYTHSLVIFWKAGRLFIFDATETGAHPELASIRMERYEDFCVVQPCRNAIEKERALEQLFIFSEPGIKYNFAAIVKIAAYEKLGLNIFKKPFPNREICSELSLKYCNGYPLKCYSEGRFSRPFFTPQDFIRYASQEDVIILFTEK